MSGGYKPFGYNELDLKQIKMREFEVAILLTPFIKEKGERFTDSEVEFLALFIEFFKDKVVKTRELFSKMFSHSKTNYDILNHFLKLGLIVQEKRGFYRLSDKVRYALQEIRKYLSNLSLNDLSLGQSKQTKLKKFNDGGDVR